MQITIGLILLIVSVGMLVVARPKQGQDCAPWLSQPWILGQVYALAILAVAVVGVSFMLSEWPS
jgi:hypothetical protein